MAQSKPLGLTAAEVAAAREKHGDNALGKERRRGFFYKLWENLSDPIIRILLLAVVVEVVFTLGRCNWFEVGGILLSVMIATVVSTASECGSEKAFEKMRARSDEGTVRVIRDGLPIEITASEVVVGDILLIRAGEEIAADGELINGSITVDQSALNGESHEVVKHTGRPTPAWELSDPVRVYRGSLVATGEGMVRVLRVGSATYYGIVARDVQAQAGESPLKARLAKLAGQISRIGYVMAGVVGFAYLFGAIVAENGFAWDRILGLFNRPMELFSILLHALTLMITVVVVAVPEGLPMMITVVLSANMRRMYNDGVLVKKPVGIETAGSMNILFTDKTGTLTTGKIRLDRIRTGEDHFRTSGALRRSGEVYQRLLESAFYNTDVSFGEHTFVGGNATDRAIAAFFAKEKPRPITVLEKIPFTSERKFSAIRVEGREPYVLIKGAPERILSRCRYILCTDGSCKRMDMGGFEQEYRAVAERGERVIAVAMQTPAHRDSLIFLALLYLKDPLRRDVRATVAQLHRAGIQVVMMTGDSKETAASIAAECGILAAGGAEAVLEAQTLHAMEDGELISRLPELRVICRSLPQDKTRLVRLCTEAGLVVGMTGDGINDAPALKLADVGFAMGSGTDIAKSAGDIVLVDNSIGSIAKTVQYGRTIFSSIRKFIVFQLMMNLAACGVCLIGQFFGIESPITIVQMLWVNIIMDTLGGLAFAGEATDPLCMKEKPKRRKEPILNRSMLSHIVCTGAYTLLLCVLFLTTELFSFGFRERTDVYMTAFYALFIFAGIFNCFGARCERFFMFSGLSANRLFLLIMTLIGGIQISMIYFGGALFRCVPLTGEELLRVIALAFTVIPFDFCRRAFDKLLVPRK